MKKRHFLSAFSVAAIFIALNSAEAAPPKKQPSTPPPKVHNVQQDVEGTLAQEKCGLLVPCKGSDKTFMYFCSSTDVTIRLCGEASTYPIDSQYKCVGPEKKLSRDNFMKYIKGQLDGIAASGGNLSPVSKDDLAALKAEGDITEHEKQCGNLEGQIKNLKAKRDQFAHAMSKEALAKIDADIAKLEGDLSPVKTQLGLCQNKQAAIKKIDDQIKDAVQTICSKGIHVPEASTFLHTVLSQYDPSKHPCGTGEGLGLAQRTKECGEAPKKLSTGQTFTLVSRNIDKDGKVLEYVKDDSSGFVWGPEAPNKLNWEDAKKYCEGLTDLGLKWHLPTREEFLAAGNKNNKDRGYNKPLREAMNMFDKWFWSSSLYDAYAWVFGGDFGNGSIVHYGDRNYQCTVRCVGR